eukprot:GILK01006341.1.p1 GENE.GILK01006341.1~~GILK01006341.1.p1  ORF type:complete len:710 (+),score=127.31 GILK01006341.1:222-2132(+)
MQEVDNEIAAVPLSSVTFTNTVGRLAELEAQVASLRTNCDFLAHVSANKEVRDASTDADKLLSEEEIASGMRADVYRRVKAYQSKGESLTSESQRLVDRLVRDYERNGLHLSGSVQLQVKELKTKLSALCVEYQKNLNEENSVLWFTEADLAGLPKDLLDELTRDEQGRYQLTLKYPHYNPCMTLCSVDTTRQAMEKAFNSRCIDTNARLLEDILQLRQSIAACLGYPSHAAYVLDTRMAKAPESVARFLSDLNAKLTPLAAKDMEALLAIKQEFKQRRGEPFDGRLHMWDYRFYMNLREKTEFHVDHEALKVYFPLEEVTQALLSLYQRLLGLTFEEVHGAAVWHAEVRLFRVWDVATNQMLGFFYLDLWPREGKYGHAACFTLQPGCLCNGSRQPAVAAMVANFSRPTSHGPALLKHSEVVTYFHEFGHVMHAICGQTNFAKFAGTAVERDFVEAPSQMLENWCWQPESLQLLSGHYEDASLKLPVDMLNRLVASKEANAGILNKRQLLFGLLDQELHSGKTVASTVDILQRLHKEVMGIEMTPGTNFAASFGHLAGGYDAQYYGYMWSEVFSVDMFYTCFKHGAGGILDPAMGRRYRQLILGPGGSRDAADMLRDFLGREPNQDAFLASKGIH